MVFFDLDGTLLDSNGVWLDIDIGFLGGHGIFPVPEDYTWYVTHHSAPDAARYTRERFGLAETAEEIQGAWLEMARQAYARRLPMKPGALELLERCRRESVPMAVLTSCIPELCRAALERHGVLDWLRGVVYAQETGLEKGNPALYRLAAERFEAAPEACVLLEDSPGYCAAARAAGFFVAGVRDELYAGREEEIKAACHSWVEDLRRLPPELEARLFGAAGTGQEVQAGAPRGRQDMTQGQAVMLG